MSSEDRKLAGSLEALSLPGLIQLLASERRVGRVDVEGPAGKGSLWLDSGELVHAACEPASGPALEGEEALDGLMGVTEGTFAFAPGEASPARTLSGPTDHLLMEAAVRRDHAGRGGAALPGTAVPAFAPLPSGGSPRYTTLQWRVLAAIDGRKDIATLAAEIQLPAPALAAILSDLEAAGVIQIT